MLLATPEQRTGRLFFPCAGPFRPFGRQKDMKERHEENTSEQLKLRTAIEYNGKRSSQKISTVPFSGSTAILLL